MKASTIIVAAVAWVTPAQACHRFSVWKYPTPQRCAVKSHAAAHATTHTDNHPYYVEITTPPPLPQPEPGDQRTPEQIKDFDDHYIELEKHKDEINKLMTILHIEEDAKDAAGIEPPD